MVTNVELKISFRIRSAGFLVRRNILFAAFKSVINKKKQPQSPLNRLVQK